MKKVGILFFFFLVLIPLSTVLGQSVIDFYMPSNGNKASFHMLNLTEGSGSITRIISYINNNDGSYETQETNFMNGEPVSIIQQTVYFTKTEVKISSSIIVSALFPTRSENYNPPKIILKMPESGKTSTWFAQQEKEEDKPSKYTSSWASNITVDGVTKRVIKVIIENPYLSYKEVKYYVEGIGLMKEGYISEGKEILNYDLDGISYTNF